jgi:hypothetical protein
MREGAKVLVRYLESHSRELDLDLHVLLQNVFLTNGRVKNNSARQRQRLRQCKKNRKERIGEFIRRQLAWFET